MCVCVGEWFGLLSFRVVVIVIVLINGDNKKENFCKTSYKCQDMRIDQQQQQRQKK